MPWNPSDDTMIILHTREMLELHTNFTKAAEKAKHGPWTCVLWRFNVSLRWREALGIMCYQRLQQCSLMPCSFLCHLMHMARHRN